jgi:hypothetical protein
LNQYGLSRAENRDSPHIKGPAISSSRAGKWFLPLLQSPAERLFYPMDYLRLQEILGWCIILNFGLLLWWFFVFTFAKNWLHRLHGRWFRLSPEQFDQVHYTLMGVFKLGVILLNVGPYIALRISAP